MLKLFEMFAGYGGASHGLRKAGIPFECVGYSEIDKYAIQCYEQNFPGPQNYGDARNIDPKDLPDFDLLTGGFPCQAFSIAGKGLGECDPRGTLFHEIIRIAEVKKPKWMLLENVKGLLSEAHSKTFKKILSELNRIGYEVSWKVLNSKDYGIPQNRERIWFVCIRKDIFEPLKFSWPECRALNLFLEDILEPFSEKYILSEAQKNRIKKGRFNPKIAHCLTGGGHSGGNHSDMDAVFKNDKWCRLTPSECFRLMGFLNDEINLEGLSDTQKYKLAGNGWDINVVSKIFQQLFKE